ncbi:DegV family protein [Pseudoflavonifractor sp. MSJ-30]|uniref:DegV family protein n=1 Tax=Pseudoflavonifractor sp. MSJ-30 TaxID=2841525 RepID=UPI00209CD56F|nr:DegV family protein [Pseudoflavonifractor sp. MSJ-30]
MRKQTAIVTDTNSGLRPEEAAGLGIDLIPMPVNLAGACYFEYDTITQAEIFSCLGSGAEVSTSQPAPGALTDCWERLLEDCDQVVYIPMSAGTLRRLPDRRHAVGRL